MITDAYLTFIRIKLPPKNEVSSWFSGFLVFCALGFYAIAETETQMSQPKEHVSYTNYRGKIFEALEEQEYLKQTRIFSERLLKSIRGEIQKSAYSDKVKAEMFEVLDSLPKREALMSVRGRIVLIELYLLEFKGL